MTDKEKINYLYYIHTKLIERGEPIDSAKARGLRDIIYKGKYHDYDDSNFNYILSYYLGDQYKDLDVSVGTIKSYIRDKKIDIINDENSTIS